MYYFVYSLFYLISLLPLRILYFISDIIYVIIFYLIRYRKVVVLKNLQQAFPEKSDTERLQIAKKFYKNFVDSILESLKLFSTGEEFIKKHCTADYASLDRLYDENKTCQMHAAHHFNWEWLNRVISLTMKQSYLAVYMPLSNKVFEKIIYRLRTKYGSVMLPATNMKNSFVPWEKKLHCLILAADQNPGNPDNAYWVNFFNKPTPFVKGPEKAARKKACPVVFAFTKKIKRGYYHTNYILITEDASQLKEGELTKSYAEALTQSIKEQPEMWLWSHRRWKWNWKPEYGEILN